MRLALLAVVCGTLLPVIGCSADQAETAAREKTTITVPGVLSSNLRHAFRTLHDAGLRVAIRESFMISSLYSPVVSEQSPAGGTPVEAGSVVNLVRLGKNALGSPDFPTVMPSADVPDFVGEPLSVATAWAESAQLFWEVHCPPLPPSDEPTLFDAYVVAAQQPAPGSTLARAEGSRVTPLIIEAEPG